MFCYKPTFDSRAIFLKALDMSEETELFFFKLSASDHFSICIKSELLVLGAVELSFKGHLSDLLQTEYVVVSPSV